MEWLISGIVFVLMGWPAALILAIVLHRAQRRLKQLTEMSKPNRNPKPARAAPAFRQDERLSYADIADLILTFRN